MNAAYSGAGIRLGLLAVMAVMVCFTPVRAQTASRAASYSGEANCGRPCCSAHSRLHSTIHAETNNARVAA